ncbi:hypothetical protein IFO69_15030 [Echinicola sp. CAU 1574]|uniref:Methylamine utilisation protein MauE domain-containing protein n=1 Tax=Echinicola arenosa TaxID=2774144 RepID=A0ABR9AR20_9BACT|nr:hypothetical protein [Echinicola arenosa]
MTKLIQHGIVIAFLVLWTYTGLEKLMDYDGFRQSIMNQVFPEAWAEMMPPLLISVELLLAIMLLMPATRKPGLLLSLLLMTVFSTYIGLVWMGAFPRVPCSCAGFLEAMSWEGHLVFNGVFMVLGGYGVLRFESCV